MNTVAWVDRRSNIDFPVDFFRTSLRDFGAPRPPGRHRSRIFARATDRSLERQIVDPGQRGPHAGRRRSFCDAAACIKLEGDETLPSAPYLNVKLRHNDRGIQNILIDFRVARGQQVTDLLRLRPQESGHSAWHPRLKVAMRLVGHLVLPKMMTITSHTFGAVHMKSDLNWIANCE